MGPIVMISNNQGFTLIEFLVAIVILMVGLLGMLQSINMAMDKNLENMYRNEAVTVADDMMMRRQAMKFGDITSAHIFIVPRDIRGVLKNYSVRETIRNLYNPIANATQSREITINVSWNKKNKNYIHSITTYVSAFPE